MVFITIVNGVYKPTYNWGASHCRMFDEPTIGYVDLVGGIPTRLKNMKVSWDDDIPNIYIYGKKHVPNHQAVIL